jgi:hypothetical protein
LQAIECATPCLPPVISTLDSVTVPPDTPITFEVPSVCWMVVPPLPPAPALRPSSTR